MEVIDGHFCEIFIIEPLCLERNDELGPIGVFKAIVHGIVRLIHMMSDCLGLMLIYRMTSLSLLRAQVALSGLFQHLCMRYLLPLLLQCYSLRTTLLLPLCFSQVSCLQCPELIDLLVIKVLIFSQLALVGLHSFSVFISDGLVVGSLCLYFIDDVDHVVDSCLVVVNLAVLLRRFFHLASTNLNLIG